MVEKKAKILIVSGAKGGVGATTFIANAAVTLAEKENVLIVDMDGECPGDAALAFGMAGSAKTLADASNNLSLGADLVKSYLGSGLENVGLVEVVDEFDISIIKDLSAIYSHIIVDSGRDTGGVIKEVFPIAHKLIMVSGADASSIVAAKKKLITLKRMGASLDRVDIVINGFSEEAGLTRSIVEENLGSKVSSFLPSVSSDMAQASIRSTPLTILDPAHSFSSSIRKFSLALSDLNTDSTLLSEDIPVQQDEPEAGELEAIKNETPSDISVLKARALKELSSAKEIKKLIADGARGSNRAFLEQKITKAVHDILDADPGQKVRDRDLFIKEVIDEAIGLGPLEKFMADPDVTEVMVNARDEIYVERAGRISKVDSEFSSVKNIMAIVERIVAPIGRRVDESSPVVDARLPDGSRVHIIIPPLSLKGPTITIRKFSRGVLGIDDLIRYGSLDKGIADFLKCCVEARANILVSGGTGSGKTTMLNVLSSFIPEDERIVSIEDSAELKLVQPHVVRLESRPPNIEGKGEVMIRDLVRASLRMRPDRVIVGECRGAEALDMLQAMNTGHDGSLTTIHANSARDSIARLETLVLFAGFDLPVKAIREQIASAINIVIQVKREKGGARKVVNVSELTGIEGQTITMQDLFVLDGEKFISTGFRPKFMEDAFKVPSLSPLGRG